MIPWERLDTAEVPGGGQLKLSRRGTEYSIMVGTIELMNSRLSGSEEALATLTQERIADRDEAHVLIGGLGMGFTLRAALAVAGPKVRLTVSELVPAIVTWARGPMADLFDGCLDDPRVSISQGDIGELIAAKKEAFDAILLDVDNGPEGLTRRENDRLYDTKGLARTYAALRPGGVLAVWSSGPDSSFTTRLQRTGFAVEEVKVRARQKKRGARHVIWLATRP
ncbi:spermidine synthase [Aurantimonas manganoxydans SI85-9A1]|uniref:Spermidine synthase n=1 Tax=Aurantimonas manganoxydans (strain ATCC BAA-1229 / DSM 21871 / SI85-9A1) TaxID=287752 RepID=Q1YKI0_AURMS|nr:spermidine synthase [Aurantimonas manganoxydans]EAS50543.1 spermidine synthase [Aurantimonas manganoxydans SI85-9A1]MAY29028.1 spermidine synthase [Aurantimonas sp.]MCW7543239.1 spermidine synthase [Aurantimonas litoralis]